MTPEEQPEALEIAEKVGSLPPDTIAIATLDGIKSIKIENFIKQPILGMLYDLNRDMLTNFARLKSGDLRAMNDIATAKIITYLIENRK